MGEERGFDDSRGVGTEASGGGVGAGVWAASGAFFQRGAVGGVVDSDLSGEGVGGEVGGDLGKVRVEKIVVLV